MSFDKRDNTYMGNLVQPVFIDKIDNSYACNLVQTVLIEKEGIIFMHVI